MWGRLDVSDIAALGNLVKISGLFTMHLNSLVEMFCIESIGMNMVFPKTCLHMEKHANCASPPMQKYHTNILLASRYEKIILSREEKPAFRNLFISL